jgi:hypothetical protein
MIDLWYDTPSNLRLWLLISQGLLALTLVGFLILRPQAQRLSNSLLALWVERKIPRFHDRLITTVQLNSPGANTVGMSQELIESVTRDTEEEARKTDFRLVADWHRVGWSLLVLAPVALAAAVLFVLVPATMKALLARQLLGDQPIPRSISVEHATAEIWPSGEPVTLQFVAEGPDLDEPARGWVRLQTESGFVETFALEKDAKASDGQPNYAVRLPAMSEPFQFKAWIGDGRTHRPAHVTFEPRPAVVKQQAWVILPRYCGVRPNGLPYEQFMTGGDLSAFSGSRARIVAEVSKPVVKATLEVLGPSVEGKEQTVRELAMDFLPGTEGLARTAVEVTFDLRPGDSAYRLVLRDRHGFTNTHRPQRSILIQPDEPPMVTLLPERFARPGQRTGLDDTEVEGMPVPLGGPFWVSYRCRTATRLDKARFRYRVLTPEKASNPDDPPWADFPLADTKGSPEVGTFDFNMGTFEKLSFLDEIEFYALPSVNPDEVPGRQEGGGRFIFKTASLPKVKPGDKIEFYVEVQDSRIPPLVGRSEVRVKEVVEVKDLALWLQQKREETRRLQQLEARQKGLFETANGEQP